MTCTLADSVAGWTLLACVRLDGWVDLYLVGGWDVVAVALAAQLAI